MITFEKCIAELKTDAKGINLKIPTSINGLVSEYQETYRELHRTRKPSKDLVLLLMMCEGIKAFQVLIVSMKNDIDARKEKSLIINQK